MDQAIVTFARQAIPMVWDFAESNPFNGFAGDIETTCRTMARAIEELPAARKDGAAIQLDAAAERELLSVLVSTDPPYYDNIGYADLSDFFYVWLRRSI